MKVTPYGILRRLWPKQWLTWWQSADGFSQEPQYRTGWMTCGLWSNFCVWSHLMIKNGGMLPWHPAWGEEMNRQSSKLCNIWCESVISLNYFMPCICLSSFWGLFGNWQILLSAIVIYLRFAFSIRAHFLSHDPSSWTSSRLQKLLKHISIRRLKTDQDDGRPLVKLPPRTVVIQEVELSEEERTLYDSMQKHGQLIITGWDILRHCLFRYLSGLGSYKV